MPFASEFGELTEQTFDGDNVPRGPLQVSDFSRTLLPLLTEEEWADAIGAGGAGISTPDVLYVTTGGNNTTAQVANPAKPYLTIAAAKAAAGSGDLVEVGAGTWNERNWAKTGVAMEFALGSVATYTGAARGSLIDDSAESGTNAAIVASIRGDTFWNLSSYPGTTNPEVCAVITMTKPTSDVTIVARTLGTTTASPGGLLGVIDQRDGKLNVTCDEIIGGDLCSPIYWWIAGGELNVRANVIKTLDTQSAINCITTTVDTTATGEMYVIGCGLIQSTGLAAIEHQDSHASARVWFVGIADIRGNTVGINATWTSSAAKYYYMGCGKITTTGASSNVIAAAGGVFWMTFQKLTIPNGGARGVWITGGTVTMDLVLDELECEGSATNIVLLNNAASRLNLTIRKHVGTANSGGILVTAGTLRLSDSRIDTSANASTQPLSGAASQTIYLRNVHLQSGSAASITNSTGSGTLTIVSLGGVSMNVAPGANVTITGPYTVGADVKQLGALTATTGNFSGNIVTTGSVSAATALLTAITATSIESDTVVADTYNGVAIAALAPLVSPTFTTPNIGAATGTSLVLSGAISATSCSSYPYFSLGSGATLDVASTFTLRFANSADFTASKDVILSRSAAATLGLTGNLTASGTVRLGTFTVGTLPAAGTAGRTAYVTDSNAASYTAGIGTIVAAGAPNTIVPVFDDGTNWRIG